MKKVIHATFHTLKKAVPLYLAVLVVCGVLANAGVSLPGPLRWAYEPVEKTTAYAASVAESIEQAQAAQQASPETIVSETGVFWNTYVTNEGEEVPYVIRVPAGITANMPLVVYLHAEDVTSIPALAKVGPVQAAENNNVNNCIIIQPLSESSWAIEKKEAIVCELTQHIVSKFYCDESRVILTGFESGTVGVWYYAALNPEYWNKISPVGAAPKTDIRPLIGKDVSYYIIYGEYEEYSIKGDMKRIGRTMMDNGAAVVQCEIPGATHDDIRNNSYDTHWFTWVCQ